MISNSLVINSFNGVCKVVFEGVTLTYLDKKDLERLGTEIWAAQIELEIKEGKLCGECGGELIVKEDQLCPSCNTNEITDYELAKKLEV